jgi:hypothetical protein
LQHTSVYVCCSVEIILIENGVTGSSGVKPFNLELVFHCRVLGERENKFTRWGFLLSIKEPRATYIEVCTMLLFALTRSGLLGVVSSSQSLILHAENR